MSAPTSLIISSKEQQATMYSSLKTTSIGELSSISENGSSSKTTKPIKLDYSASPQDKLIELKFNELARKILEELMQAQHSKDFFRAIDEILKEPANGNARTATAAKSRTDARPRRLATNDNQKLHNNNTDNQNQVPSNHKQQQQQPQQSRATEPSHYSNNNNNNDQPRSLPLDVAHLIHQQQQLKQQQLQLQKHQQQQLLQHQKQQQLNRPQKSAIPVISGQNGFSSPRKSFAASASATSTEDSKTQLYPLSRSVTAGEANFKKQQQISSSSSSGLKRSSTVVTTNNFYHNNNNNLEAEPIKPAKASNSGVDQRRRPRSSTDMFTKLVNRRSIGDDDDDDDDDEDGEFDDDDDDDDDDGVDNGDDDDEYEDEMNRQRDLYHQQQGQTRFNPIAKSRTLSDTTNISEMKMLTARKVVGTRLQQPQQQQTNQKQQRQRFNNPIVRSNTIAANHHHASQRLASAYNTNNNNNNNNKDPARETRSQNSSSSTTSHVMGQQQQQEPKSMILNSRDIGSLYKPHMNYSTSVLGNHRLSDDDEIIIIPTQSPSLVSTSPDGCDGGANVNDDLSERFSISRTKSFWEKLSKGNHHGRRSVVNNNDESAPSSRCDGALASTTITNGNNKQLNHHHQQQQLDKQHLAGAKRAPGRIMNGHSHTLDRMDSTGGSNSNYSCSSSGDENSGCHSQQNATISQLQQEMSRQNRFRQTR